MQEVRGMRQSVYPCETGRDIMCPKAGLIEDIRGVSIICGVGIFVTTHPALRIIREEIRGASGF
jgi:hypothetical protein